MVEGNRCGNCGGELGDEARSRCSRCGAPQSWESTVSYEAPDELPRRTFLLRDGERFGPYHVIRMLGSGGMGAVYEAEHIDSGRRVAVKILNHRLQSPEHRRRFLREGRLAASINHPNTVYVYGTEEIAGTPVIAMEMAGGGNLYDRVKRDGPLAVGEAVDVILDVIAGLESAHTAGVLHRDVKPANCFFDADGTVKIGDFGLSISSTLRGETNLTQSGVFLGTPAFASPEQLRGDELDVRSDIYSVGSTLYYLLTGSCPFEAQQMVHLLATVLERPAPSPRATRPEVPEGLAKIILRCLAKQSGQRFPDYSALRQALLPYRSEAPTPATLGLRVVSYLIDTLVLAFLCALLPWFWLDDLANWEPQFEALSSPGPQPTADLNRLTGVGMLLQLAYFALTEGIWGASGGKAICRLRVVGPHREPPGVARALLRGGVFAGAAWMPWWVAYAVNPELTVRIFAGDVSGIVDSAVAATRTVPVGVTLPALLIVVAPAFFFLLFVSMRRTNGYAGLHELSSGTRVIRMPVYEARPALAVPDRPLPETREAARFGPFDVLGALQTSDGSEMLLAFDTRLLRKVWVRRCAAEAPPVTSDRRELSRIGRLRWLNGHRGADGGWDAYEAPTGAPFLSLVETPQPWGAVRFWLLDIARELEASRQDGTPPEALSLDRLWITADGRAKLLDFRAPHIDSDGGELATVAATQPADDVAVFVKRMAIAALEGRVPSYEEVAGRTIRSRIPLPARALLNDLGKASSSGLPLDDLEMLTRRPAAVSAARRVGAFAACWLLPVLLAAWLVVDVGISERRFLSEHPEVGELAGYVAFYQTLPEDSAQPELELLREAVALATVVRFGETIHDTQLWENRAMRGFVDSDGRALLEEFVASNPAPSPEEIEAALRRIEPVQGQLRMLSWSVHDYLYSGPLPIILLIFLSATLGMFVIVPSLVSTLLIGDTLLLRFLEVAVVVRNGAPASRLRVLFRNAILWLAVLLGLGLLAAMATLGGRPRVGILLVIYWTVLVFTSPRGLHDRIAGTWLVPR